VKVDEHICGFNQAWIGKCKAPVDSDGERCEKHSLACVSCGAPATHTCDQTGQFVCGAPLCDECTHNTHPEGHNGGIGFNALQFPEGMKTHCKKSEQKYAPWYVDEDNLHKWKAENGIPEDQEVVLTGSP
jgi:hypothetical protein